MEYWMLSVLKTLETDSLQLGVIYRNDSPTFEGRLSVHEKGPLAGQETDMAVLKNIMEKFA